MKSTVKKEQIEDNRREKLEVESLRVGLIEGKYLNKNLKEVSKWAMSISVWEMSVSRYWRQQYAWHVQAPWRKLV